MATSSLATPEENEPSFSQYPCVILRKALTHMGLGLAPGTHVFCQEDEVL